MKKSLLFHLCVFVQFFTGTLLNRATLAVQQGLLLNAWS